MFSDSDQLKGQLFFLKLLSTVGLTSGILLGSALPALAQNIFYWEADPNLPAGYIPTGGADWNVDDTNRTYTNVHGSGIDINVQLLDPDGQNVDSGNPGTAAGTTTLTNSSRFGGPGRLTFGMTSTNSDQKVSLVFTFSQPVLLEDFLVGDIDSVGDRVQFARNGYQDEIDFSAQDESGNNVPVTLSHPSGISTTVVNISGQTAVALYGDFSNRNIPPEDQRSQVLANPQSAITQLRIDYSNGPDNGGLSDDHAVIVGLEEGLGLFQFEVAPQDFSDAPADGESAPDGSSTTGYGEASHIIVSGTRLGANINAETNAQNSPNADSDTDDDGVTIPSLTAGQTATITAEVAGAGGYLQGWIDWDGDGSFDAGEQVATDIQDNGAGDDDNATGTISFDVDVPSGAITSAATFARFRWSTTQGLDSTTSASDGEVEDYQVTIADLPVARSLTPPACAVEYATTLFPEIIFDNISPENTFQTDYLLQNVTTWNGQSVDMQVNFERTPVPDRTSGVPQTDADGIMHFNENLPVNGPMAVTYTFVEAGTSNPIPINALLRIGDLDAEESITIPKNQIDGYTINDPTNMSLINLADDYTFEGIASFRSFVAEDLVELVLVNRSSITVTYDTDTPGHTNAGFSLDARQLAQFDQVTCRDFGDAPDSYGDSSHIISGTPTVYLGALFPDSDINSRNTANHSNDGIGDGDEFSSDEDGVTLSTLTPGTTVAVPITANGNGVLNAWIDWNADGDFDDADEQVATDADISGGTLDVTVPNTATEGDTYARFRYSSNTGLTPTGSATDGEVEDYQVEIAAAFESPVACGIDDPPSTPDGTPSIYGNNIYWFDWSSAGTFANGTTRTVNFTLPDGRNVDVEVSVTNESATGNVGVEPIIVNLRRPIAHLLRGTGSDSTDIGGSGTNSALRTDVSGEFDNDVTVSFKFSQPLSIFYADGEASGNTEIPPGTGDNQEEHVNAVTNGEPWVIIDSRNPGTGFTLQTTDSGRNLLFNALAHSDDRDEQGTPLAISRGATEFQAILDTNSNGRTGVSLGVFLPDVGDAPASYGIAAHQVNDINCGTSVDPYLGAQAPDGEDPADVQSDSADGDNSGSGSGRFSDDPDSATPAGPGDEDGVQLNGSLLQGQSLAPNSDITLDITTVQNGVLNAWIDWDGNGEFDSGEQIATNVAPSDGIISLPVTVPANAQLGTTYARFRYGSEADVGATGYTTDGEVEDYQVTIAETTGTIRGQVFDDTDTDPNGVLDAAETAVDEVTVNLYNAAGELQATAITAAGGFYEFSNLAPGEYYVEIETPDEKMINPVGDSGDNNDRSDFNYLNSRTTTFTVAGGDDLTFDAALITDTDGDLIPNVDEQGDRDGDGIPDAEEIDPAGFFYDQTTGRIIPGGSILVEGPNGEDSVNLVDDGADGSYQFFGLEAGVYTIMVNAPGGFELSDACGANTGAFDPTGGADPTVLGSGENANSGFLVDADCGDNPFYLTFDLEAGDPLVINNNIALQPVDTSEDQTIVDTPSETSCSAQGGTLVGSNLSIPLDNGTFGFANGDPDQSPANDADPYPGVITGGNYRHFYDINHGDYGYVANDQRRRNSAQHENITDPVYGASGRFFASDPNDDTPTLTTELSGLDPNKFYEYSFWAANSEFSQFTPNNNVNIKIDGEEVYSTGELPAIEAALEWRKHFFTFTNGVNTAATIELQSTEIGAQGNDFYLDNIEVRECQFEVDYGDAPASYGDAIHTTIPSAPTVYLGAVAPDAETSNPNSGNDSADGDSDDAFASLANAPTFGSYDLTDIPVNNSSGGDVTLHGWIDFNQDGQFGADEYQSVNVANGATTADLSWTIPNGTTQGSTFVRLRISPNDLGADDAGTTEVDERSQGAVINGEVEDYSINLDAGEITISGTVFEDVNYGGGPGRNKNTAETSAVNSSFPPIANNATGSFDSVVELYRYVNDDTTTSELIATTLTDDDGFYLFEDDDDGNVLPGGHYLVRVVNESVLSNRDINDTGEPTFAVQTFRNDPDEATTEITNEVGGAHPALEDAGEASFGDTLPSNAQSVTAISSTEDVTDVDFGFNFDTIVNTNDAGQGSFRQFLSNSRELADEALLAQDLPGEISAPRDKNGATVNLEDYETSIFMIPDPNNDSRVVAGTGVGEINLTTSPPDGGGGSAFVINIAQIAEELRVVDQFTSVDGRTQGVNIPSVQNTPNTTIGSNETTGAEIIINRSSGGDLIYGQFDNLIFHSIGLLSEGSTTNAVGLLLSNNGTPFSPGLDIQNAIVEDLTVATSNCGIIGARMVDSVIRNSIVRDSGAENACNNIQIRSNSHNNLVEDNLILRSAHYGIQIVAETNDGNIIRNNDIVGSGTEDNRDRTAGIGLRAASNTTIINNRIRESVGNGIVVTTSASNGNKISQNSIYNNGDLGIDLGTRSGVRGFGGDDKTENDDGDGDNGGNRLQNFPVITSITAEGSAYRIEGTLNSTASSNFEIELFSNAVCNPDVDGNSQADIYGEGEQYHVTVPVTTDASGNTTFSATVQVSEVAGTIFSTTATATSTQDTSEFSECVGINPELLLVKRITAINPGQGANETQFNNFVNDSETADNRAYWPGGTDDTSSGNTYTLGEIDGGQVKPGDEIEYTIYFLSHGTETARNVWVCDLIPENTEFVPRGFEGETAADGGLPGAARGILREFDGGLESFSNGNDGDGGYYLAPGVAPENISGNIECGQTNTNGAIVVNLGDLDHATSQGNPENSFGFIRFRVIVK